MPAPIERGIRRGEAHRFAMKLYINQVELAQTNKGRDTASPGAGDRLMPVMAGIGGGTAAFEQYT